MFSNAELSIIKNVFADNEELLYAIRNVFHQFPLSDTQLKSLQTQITPEVIAILKKRILPTLDPDAPLSQLADIRVTLTEQLKTKSIQDMAPLLAAKETEMTYLRERFEALECIVKGEEPAKDALKLVDLANFTNVSEFLPEEAQFENAFHAVVGLTAYLFLLGYIDPRLNDLKIIAGIKEETPDEQKKRLERNSTK